MENTGDTLECAKITCSVILMSSSSVIAYCSPIQLQSACIRLSHFGRVGMRSPKSHLAFAPLFFATRTREPELASQELISSTRGRKSRVRNRYYIIFVARQEGRRPPTK